MPTISITITGNREVQAKVKRLGSSLFKMRRAMGATGRELATYYSKQGFSSQGGVYGARWARLSDRYAIRKAKSFPGKPVLVATGSMQNNFTYAAGEQSVIIGNKSEHFKYHQSTAPRTKMPRRQMMGINSELRLRIKGIIEEDIARKIREA